MRLRRWEIVRVFTTDLEAALDDGFEPLGFDGNTIILRRLRWRWQSTSWRRDVLSKYWVTAPEKAKARA